MKMQMQNNANLYTTYDNFMVAISLFQCFAFFIGGIYLMSTTKSSISYCLGFTACILGMFSLQTLAGLYEKGPYPGNYNKTSRLINNICMSSGFSLLFGLFYDALAMGHIHGFIPSTIYGVVGTYITICIYNYFQLTNR